MNETAPCCSGWSATISPAEIDCAEIAKPAATIVATAVSFATFIKTSDIDNVRLNSTIESKRGSRGRAPARCVRIVQSIQNQCIRTVLSDKYGQPRVRLFWNTHPIV